MDDALRLTVVQQRASEGNGRLFVLWNWFSFPGTHRLTVCVKESEPPSLLPSFSWCGTSPRSHRIPRSSSSFLRVWYTDAGRAKKAQPREPNDGPYTRLSPRLTTSRTQHAGRRDPLSSSCILIPLFSPLSPSLIHPFFLPSFSRSGNTSSVCVLRLEVESSKADEVVHRRRSDHSLLLIPRSQISLSQDYDIPGDEKQFAATHSCRNCGSSDQRRRSRRRRRKKGKKKKKVI